MVVIVIIGILAGLAIPAIINVRIRATEGRVNVEINNLASAIGSFKAKYGVEPPSSFNLYLTQAGWNGDATSTSIVRRIWPQFDFTMTMPDPANPGNNRVAYPQYWATAFPSGSITLNGSECLLFFLGGVMNDNASGTNQAPTGFSKNPAWPFAPIIGSANTNREGPFFEFTDVSRIKDYNGNGLNEWYDPIPNQTTPYLYFSSYEGAGFRTTELTWNPYGTFPSDVYRVSSTAGTLPPATPAAAFPGNPLDSRSLPAQKAQTFQIISPGYDGLFGYGGVFNPNLPNSGLMTPAGAPDLVAYDNIANFNGGRLKP
jgi:hypothetical protein